MRQKWGKIAKFVSATPPRPFALFAPKFARGFLVCRRCASWKGFFDFGARLGGRGDESVLPYRYAISLRYCWGRAVRPRLLLVVRMTYSSSMPFSLHRLEGAAAITWQLLGPLMVAFFQVSLLRFFFQSEALLLRNWEFLASLPSVLVFWIGDFLLKRASERVPVWSRPISVLDKFAKVLCYLWVTCQQVS